MATRERTHNERRRASKNATLACAVYLLVACAPAPPAQDSPSSGFQPHWMQQNGIPQSYQGLREFKEIDFRLIRTTPSKHRGYQTGYYLFRNESDHSIEIPWISFDSDGFAFPSEATFQVLKAGKWVNPGYFTDLVPLYTQLDAGKAIMFKTDIPIHLWQRDIPFRLTFGWYVSKPTTFDKPIQ